MSFIVSVLYAMIGGCIAAVALFLLGIGPLVFYVGGRDNSKHGSGSIIGMGLAYNFCSLFLLALGVLVIAQAVS